MRWILVIALCVAAGAASSQAQMNVGLLTCTLAETGDSDATPPSESRAMVCVFKPEGTGPEESYSGEIRKVGTQETLGRTPVLIWAVLGSGKEPLRPGHLEQTYVGEPATSPAAQAPQMLVGEDNKSFRLRPMTDNRSESATGSVTVVVLKMRTVPA